MLLSVIGVTIDLRFDESVPAVVRAHIARTWSRCAALGNSVASLVAIASLVAPESGARGGGGEGRHIVARNAELLEQQVARCLTLWAIEIQRSSMWLFHAVGLADADGRTIALAAPSHTGKTTLASAVGKRLGYVTDETLAVVPDSLRVVPYPKPLSVIVHPGDPKHQVGPDELGLKQLACGLRLVRLGLLSRVPGTREPRIEHIGLREALFELAPEISLLSGRPRSLQSLGDLIAGLGGAVRVVYGEVADATHLLESLLCDPTPIDREWEPAGPAQSGAVSGEGVRAGGDVVGGRGVFRRSPEVSDAIWIGDALVVLSGTRLSHVDGLGAVVWGLIANESVGAV